MPTLQFAESDKKLIQKFLDLDRNIEQLTKEEQDRWTIMMVKNDEFSDYYSDELKLREDVDKALKEKDVIEVREQVDTITDPPPMKVIRRRKGFFKRLLKL